MAIRLLQTWPWVLLLAAATWPNEAPAPNRRAHDHIGQFNFKVEIEGVAVAAFRNVEGLDSETEVIEYRDGQDIMLRKRPGHTKLQEVKMVGPWSDTQRTLLDWQQEKRRRTRTVDLMLVESVSHKGQPRVRCKFTLHNATLKTARVDPVKRNGHLQRMTTIVLRPTKITNTCRELYKHPRLRKSR